MSSCLALLILFLFEASSLLCAEPLPQQPFVSSRLTAEWAHARIQLQTIGQVRALSRAEMEEFLRTAEIVSTQTIGTGVTESRRAVLTDGQLTHDAHIQTVDISKGMFRTAQGTEINFRDSYKFNIAAYRLDTLLDLNMVPVSVDREVSGEPAAVTWWLDDVLMGERERIESKVRPPDMELWTRQMYVVRVFDELIYNTDRNPDNLLITHDGKVWMIDHTRAFRIQSRLRHPERLVRCDRRLLERLRGLDEETLTRELGAYVTRAAIGALLARRDLTVTFFDEQVARYSEAVILFDLPQN